MNIISLQKIPVLFCFLIATAFSACVSKSSNTTDELTPNFIIYGEIEIQDPVFLFINRGEKILYLITTESNAISFAERNFEIDVFLRLPDVYFRGQVPSFFDSDGFRNYPTIGEAESGDRVKLSENVNITSLKNTKFLLVFIDDSTFKRTQLNRHSYHFETKHDWVFLKTVFPMGKRIDE